MNHMYGSNFYLNWVHKKIGLHLIVLALLELKPVNVFANVLPNENAALGQVLAENPHGLFQRYSLPFNDLPGQSGRQILLNLLAYLSVPIG